jgi:hypothetical protein
MQCGKNYHLTGPRSENMHFCAQEYSMSQRLKAWTG